MTSKTHSNFDISFSTRAEQAIPVMSYNSLCIKVNLLKNSMSVVYDENVLNPGKIIGKVEELGYGAALHKEAAEKTEAKPVDAAANETR